MRCRHPGAEAWAHEATTNETTRNDTENKLQPKQAINKTTRHKPKHNKKGRNQTKMKPRKTEKLKTIKNFGKKKQKKQTKHTRTNMKHETRNEPSRGDILYSTQKQGQLQYNRQRLSPHTQQLSALTLTLPSESLVTIPGRTSISSPTRRTPCTIDPPATPEVRTCLLYTSPSPRD